jgi:two-component system cell cycle sensor histidine kinase/response regulator CckA
MIGKAAQGRGLRLGAARIQGPLDILHLEGSACETGVIRATLAAGGVPCNVRGVTAAEAFRAALAGRSFDLILADCSRANGPLVLDTAMRDCPHTPVIVLSETPQEEHAVACLRRGAADWVVKDRLARLPAAVRRAVSDARRTRQRRENEECLREFAENIHGFFWMTGPGGEPLLYASPAYGRIWGRPLDSLRARPRERIEAIVDEDRHRVEQALAALGTGRSYDEEYRIRRPDGSIRWIWDRGRPAPEGKIRFLVGVAEDITRRKELEAQLAHSQKLESLGRLAGGVAHDLNNQLSVILGSTGLAMQADLDGAVHQDLEMVLTAGERAAALTRQLLAFSRRQVLRPVVTDLNAVLRSAKTMLVRVLGEDIDLIVRTDADPGTVKVDPGQIEQVIVNLAINARDAMPDGGKLTIETAVESAEPGRCVLLAVSDTGSGMDGDTLAQVFEPFFTTKEAGKGTGLGLSVAHGIVRQSGGEIVAASKPGIGSTFKVYLPLVEDEPEVVQPVAVNETVRGSETILLVEDDELVLDVQRRVLTRCGYRVIATTSPTEAVELCGQCDRSIDLLVTDVVMPGMNGRELARRVTSLQTTARVLYVSGYAPPVAGKATAGSLLVEKPILANTFARAVREAIQRPVGRAKGGTHGDTP